MAVTHYTLTATFTDLLGAAYSPTSSAVVAWIETNVADTEGIVDDVANLIALGPQRQTADSAGLVTFANLIGSDSAEADINIAAGTLQYRVTAEYVNAQTRKRGQRWSSGWFSLTANTNLADVVAEQYIPATYISQATAELDDYVAGLETTLDGYVTDAETAKTGAEAARDLAEQYRDEAHDISMIDTSDGVVEALIQDSGSDTATALTASTDDQIDLRGGTTWTTGTAYRRGQAVVNPSGAVVTANVNHTAAASYATDTAKWDAVSSVLFALPPTNGKRPVGKDELFINVKDYGATGDGSTDDTTAINAAVTASGWPTTRATIYFPPGEYLISSSITISGAGLGSTPNLDIIGWGAKLKTTTPGITMLDITNSTVSLTRVRVRGFQFLINAGAAATGIRLHNAQFCVLSELDFLGSYGLGIQIDGTSTYNTISGCTFSSLARGIYIPGSAHYLSITDCHFGEQTAGSPLNWIQADTVQSVNVTVAGCTFYGEGNTLPALNIVYGFNWSVTGCKFGYCSDVALFIGSDGVSYSHTISGCTFDHNGKDDIKVNGGRLNVITGCTFGIRKAATTTSTYCNVTILNTFGGAAGSDNTVVGCTSKDTSTALLASFSAASACQNVAFLGNHYTIATVNANTSAAIFGRDGAVVPTGKFVTKDGITLPGVLARVTGIDAKTVAATTLYTVPTGKTAIITGAVVQSGSASSITVGPTIGIGIAAGEDDIYASTAMAGLTSNAKTYVFPPPGLQASAAAASVIKVGIDTASTGTSQTVAVALLGYLL